MIHNKQEIEAFRFVHANRVNLTSLKSQIDLNVLKITMLINNMSELGQNQRRIFTRKHRLEERAVQTSESLNMADYPDPQFSKSSIHLKAVGSDPITQMSQTSNVLAQKFDYGVNKSNINSDEQNCEQENYKMKKNKEVCYAQADSQINLELCRLQNISQLSPIKFIKYSKTDRTQKSFVKKMHQQNRIFITSDCISKLQAELSIIQAKSRKEVTDPKVRLNLLKKIEEKFQANLVKEKTH